MEMTYQQTKTTLLPLLKVAKEIVNDCVAMTRMLEEVQPMKDKKQFALNGSRINVTLEKLTKCITDVEHYNNNAENILNLSDSFSLLRAMQYFLMMIAGLQELGAPLETIPSLNEITQIFTTLCQRLSHHIQIHLNNALDSLHLIQNQNQHVIQRNGMFG